MGKKRVLLVNNSVYLPGEGGYKRTMYMFDMMKRREYEVTLVTGDFNHYNKQVRNVESFRSQYPDYKDIVFLHMPKYSKNISFKRYFSEKYWSHQFKKWFAENAENYDVVLFSDIDYILPVDRICTKHGIKKIVDIRDLRPEAFHVIVKNELLYKILFFPMKMKANKGYACADELVAVSQEYLDRGLKTNKKTKHPMVIYLGATLDRYYAGVAKYSNSIEKNDDESWIIYAGTLGASYDLQTVLDAARIIEKKRKEKIVFKILGQGPDADDLQRYVSDKEIGNVEFLGFQPYEMMAAYLCKSDITINAVKRNASQSIINKVADYFAAGIPMLNSCTCKEQMDMVTNYQVGLNYEPENPDDLVEKIEILLDNPDCMKLYGENAKKLALNEFYREKTYEKILELIDCE